MTKTQALFVKYLATRFTEPDGSPGQSLRRIGMYFYSRYPHYYGEDKVIEDVDLSKKWWEQSFFMSQISACILLNKAAYTLGDFSNCKGTNWQQSMRTWVTDETYYKHLPKDLHKKYPKIRKPILAIIKDFLNKFRKPKPVRWRVYEPLSE